MATKNSQNGHATDKARTTAVVFADEIRIVASDRPGPYRINPETEEQREKRLAKRKALTLKAFQGAYQARKKRS